MVSKQLDGLGNIAASSREEALALGGVGIGIVIFQRIVGRGAHRARDTLPPTLPPML